MSTFEQAVVEQMRAQRRKAQAQATGAGSLEVIRKDRDEILGIAALAETTADVPGLCSKAYRFCAKADKFEIGGRDHDVVASWPGGPMIQDGDRIRAVKADEKFDPARVVGITLEKGTEHAWFVKLKPVA